MQPQKKKRSRVLLVGNTEKTGLISRYIDGKYTKVEYSVIGLDFKIVR